MSTQLLSLVPWPLSVKEEDGLFLLDEQTSILTDPETHAIGELFARMLAPALGFVLPVQRETESGKRQIVLRLDLSLRTSGSEGYLLKVTPKQVMMRSATLAGIFYASQTLRQLLPVDIFSTTPVRRQWSIPAVTIEDQPRFSWRGLMLDTARHFLPKETIFKYIDQLALHKLNRLHLHLNDDQGWRIEIKKYPRLTEVGAWRKETVTGNMRHESARNYDGIPHGGYYTQEDLREIVAYAAQRFVTIVPELEIPGHAQAAIAAYPELGVTGAQIEVGTLWGIHPHLYNPTEKTMQFLRDVCLEMMDIFPGPYFHVGGDEAIKDHWRASSEIQEQIQALGLKDEEALQGWVLEQIGIFLEQHGRRLVGWDEILEAPLPAGAIVMSWRGIKGGIEAAQANHDVVMTPTTHVYLDYYQTNDPTEPLAIGEYLPLEKTYSYEPIPADLTAEQATHVLGAQANLWTEYTPTPDRAEYMSFPRLIALAELTWSAREAKDFRFFVERLIQHEQRLSKQGIHYRSVTLLDQEASYPSRAMGK